VEEASKEEKRRRRRAEVVVRKALSLVLPRPTGKRVARGERIPESELIDCCAESRNGLFGWSFEFLPTQARPVISWRNPGKMHTTCHDSSTHIGSVGTNVRVLVWVFLFF
jgi:hypothetical protein